MGSLEERPYIVSWNLTRRCNLSCPHCYIDSTPQDSETPSLLEERNWRRGSELTKEEAYGVIDELSYLNNRMMLVLSGGEPMLREDICDIVEYASHAGFIPVLGSNGTLLVKENLRLLKDAGLRGVGISIDSTRSATHDSFRGLEGAWERSMDALRLAKEAGLETQLDSTLTKSRLQEIEALVELGARLGAKAINFFFLVCTGRAIRTTISVENYESALRHIAKISSKERRLMVRARCAPHINRILHEDGFPLSQGTRGCLAGRSYMRIDPEGNVTPCPYMSVKVGNIKKQSLVNLWEDAPYLKLIRKGKYKGRCGFCEYVEICGGCRARALIERNDLMGEDPLCAYQPTGKRKVLLSETFKADLPWDEEARERIKKIPIFMRGMITRSIEKKAREQGVNFVTSALIDELKASAYPGFHKGK